MKHNYLLMRAGLLTLSILFLITNFSFGRFTYSEKRNNSLKRAEKLETLLKPMALSINAVRVDDETCFGNDGSIDISVSGGTAPYTYRWSNSATTQDISGLAAGTYTVIVKDKTGTQANATFTVDRTAPPNLIINSTDASCNKSDGALYLDVMGGSGEYTYYWSKGEQIGSELSTSKDLINVAAGFYTVEVTDVRWLCSTVFTAQVMEKPSFSIRASLTDVSCANPNGGAIDISIVNGGTAPFTYKWSNGATTQDLTNVPSGEYTVTVNDAIGCSATSTFTVAQIGNGSVEINGSVSHNTCPDGNEGAIQLNVTGGSTPYTYEWSTGAKSKDISQLTSGMYQVKVTDGSGCSSTATFQVNSNDSQAPQLVLKKATVTLNANGTGSLTAAAVDNGTSDNCSFELQLDRTTFSCSDAGETEVTVTATDKTGNTSSSTAIIEVVDNIAPVAKAKSSIEVKLDAQGNVTVNPDMLNNGSSDNCHLAFDLDKKLFTCENLGTNTATFKVTDNGNNVSTASVQIVVLDNLPPQILLTDTVITVREGRTTTLSLNNKVAENCTLSNLTLSKSEFTVNDTGEHEITVIAKDASGNTSTKTIIVSVEQVTGLSENQLTGISVYPNPVNRHLKINLTNMEDKGDVHLQIHALTGQKVLESKISMENNVLDVRAIPDGIYILRLIQQDKVMIEKIKIEH